MFYSHQFGRSLGAIGAVLKERHLIWALEEDGDFNKGDYGGGYSQGRKEKEKRCGACCQWLSGSSGLAAVQLRQRGEDGRALEGKGLGNVKLTGPVSLLLLTAHLDFQALL